MKIPLEHRHICLRIFVKIKINTQYYLFFIMPKNYNVRGLCVRVGKQGNNEFKAAQAILFLNYELR